MTHQPDAHIDLILRFIEALYADPGAAPPPGLDAADIALARDLARTYARSALDDSMRERIWQRALADAVRLRLDQSTHAMQSPLQSQSHTQSRSQSNGHYARQETEAMFTQPSAITQTLPRQRLQQRAWQHQPRSRGIWITGLVAAISALVIGGLLFAGLGDSQPPATDSNMGAGIGVTSNDDQQITGPSATPETPVLEALRDLPVQSGPGAEYSVLMMLVVGDRLDITGISADGAWYQVLVPGGSSGWVTVSAALLNVYGDLDNLPVVIVPTPTFAPSPTPTASPTYTATPGMTATAANLYLYGTPTPIQFQPGAGPTVIPVTATPMLAYPTLSAEDFAGIYQRMWREYSKWGSVETLWSDNGRYLVVLYDDEVEEADEIEIYDPESPNAPVVINHDANVTAMAVNPSGSALAIGTEDGDVYLHLLYDAEDFVALDVCEEECTITGVEFNPPGTYLLIHSEEEWAQYIHIFYLPDAFHR